MGGTPFHQSRSDNLRLQQWQKQAEQLQAENEALRRLLKLKETVTMSFVTARVVGGTGNIFSHHLLLDSGSKDGVMPGQAIISSQGIVGRVTEAGATSAGVLMITDINSRIPVIGETSREKSILGGDNSAEPLLLYTVEKTRLKVGERVVTAADGGLIPAGIPVGEVAEISGAAIRVKPYVDFSTLEYVQAVTPSQP